jgi:phosphatidylglycerol:prolipoprotein diacylglycerol transferase
MRQTLFFIPHEVFGIPVFGLGWALAALVLFAVILLIASYRKHGSPDDFFGYVFVLAIAATAIYAVLPELEVKGVGGVPLGLPIRGYGVFVLMGIVAGVALSVYRTRQIGMDPELIYSLALWMFVLAIFGARLFFIIQFWPNFVRPNWGQTILAMLKFTEGGLVVYGAVMGGIVALYLFSRKHSINMFKLGDVIAPGMALGLCLGRIGCLMNGCCYGGVCEPSVLAVTFPRHPYPEQVSAALNNFSPPYGDQLAHGPLYGFRLAGGSQGEPIVVSVDADSQAYAAGLRSGMQVVEINNTPVVSLAEAKAILGAGPLLLHLLTTRGDSIAWKIADLPSRSLPTHATQIYSSINALLMCLVVWYLYPFRRHHGEILLALLVMYSLTRFTLEAIRTDEVGQWGTPFTISQLVSMIVLVLCVVAWSYLQRQPRLDPPRQVAASS